MYIITFSERLVKIWVRMIKVRFQITFFLLKLAEELRGSREDVTKTGYN